MMTLREVLEEGKVISAREFGYICHVTYPAILNYFNTYKELFDKWGLKLVKDDRYLLNRECIIGLGLMSKRAEVKNTVLKYINENK